METLKFVSEEAVCHVYRRTWIQLAAVSIGRSTKVVQGLRNKYQCSLPIALSHGRSHDSAERDTSCGCIHFALIRGYDLVIIRSQELWSSVRSKNLLASCLLTNILKDQSSAQNVH